MKKTIGAALVASPFILLTALIYKAGGWLDVVLVWGTTFVILGMVIGGVVLMSGDEE